MKRIFDIVGTLVLLPVLLPIIALVALLIHFRLGQPVLFRQPRLGRDGVPFDLIKFRTMRVVEEASIPASDAERLTALGKILRDLSLDELPEFLNVLKGDMSLIGPRPLLVRYLPRYTTKQARRHEVRPGISGWAQINGRNHSRWPDRFEMDVWYVDNMSFTLDVQIIAMTIMKVFSREGISEPGRETMSEFMGDEQESTEGKE